MTCFGENGKHWTAVYRLYHFKLVVTSMRSGGHFACAGASFLCPQHVRIMLCGIMFMYEFY